MRKSKAVLTLFTIWSSYLSDQILLSDHVVLESLVLLVSP